MRLRFAIFLLCILIATGFLPFYSLAQVKLVSTTFSKNLAIPDQGPDVKKLQTFLINNGYLAGGSPTGYFGKQTMLAVIKWQENVGLPKTGFFGPMSRAAINLSASSVESTPQVAVSVPEHTATNMQLPDRDLKVGDTGKDVLSLQTYLINQGLLSIKKPTGTFGGLTKIALQKLQSAANIPATGYFGPKTRLNISKIVENKLTDNASESVLDAVSNIVVNTISATPTAVPIYNPTINSGGGGGGGGSPVATITSSVGTSTISTTASSTSTTTQKILDIIAPRVFINNPISSSTVTNLITTNITATDNVKVARVELYVDMDIKGVSSTSPYIFSLDTSLFSPGQHVLIAKAYDAAGNSSTTASTTINFVAPAPSIPQNLLITSVASSSVSLAWASSTETGGSISGYKIYQGNTQVGTSTKLSFKHTGLTSSTTYSYGVASFDAAGFTSATSTLLSTTTLPILSIATSTPTSTPSLDFGIALGDSLHGFNAAKIDQTLNAIATLGIQYIRVDMQWPNIQTQADQKFFDWADTDRLVAAANTHHIKVLAILDYTTSWADDPACPAGTVHCAPVLPVLFASYAKAAVQRYSSKGVSAWEIWNEPNNGGFWGPEANCNAYTRLLKLTYTAIKQADPAAVVITGGLSPAATDGVNISPTDFLSCVYSNGGKNYFDAVSDHPYTFPQLPSDPVPHAWAQMSTTTPSLRSIMIANGDANKKIWITEFGAPTNGPDPKWFVSETKQSQMLTDAANLYRTYDWVGPLFWYTLKDSGTSTSTNENFFGLIHVDGTPKPAFNTLKNIVSEGQ